MYNRYYWFCDTGLNWLPSGGTYYTKLNVVLNSANSYFSNIGISGVSLDQRSSWLYSSGFDSGVKYYHPLVSGYVATGEEDYGYSDEIGYCFRFDFVQPVEDVSKYTLYVAQSLGKGGGDWDNTTIS